MGGLVGLMWLVVLGGGAAVAMGALGRSVAHFDTINHFLPHIAITLGTFAVAALPIGRWVIAAIGAAGAVWATTTVMADGACPAPAAGGAELSVLAFNVQGRNLDLEAIEARIRAIDADIVVLEEYGAAHTPVGTALADLYPERIDCALQNGCRLALFARMPWSEVWISGRDQDTPPIVRARFADDGIRPAFTVVGTHIQRPLGGGARHVEDFQVLAGALAAIEGPTIVAGDFNATPWSYALADFRAATGLCGASGYRPSWPAWLSSLGLPIDHVLVSEGVGIETEMAEPAGSDHLPVRAVVRLPDAP